MGKHAGTNINKPQTEFPLKFGEMTKIPEADILKKGQIKLKQGAQMDTTVAK